MVPSQSTVISSGPCIHQTNSRSYVDFITIRLSDNNNYFSKEWTVVVGDICAVACDQSKGHTTPFSVPWSAVQILSIYSTTSSATTPSTTTSASKKKKKKKEDESSVASSVLNTKKQQQPMYNMTIRWFYRYEELPEIVIDKLGSIALEEDTDTFTVYETNEAQSDYPFDAILGKVVFQRPCIKNASSSSSTTTTTTSSVVHLTCHTYIDTETGEYKHVKKDWREYHLFHAIVPTAFTRGFCTEQDETLINATFAAFCGDRLNLSKNSTNEPYCEPAVIVKPTRDKKNKKTNDTTNIAAFDQVILEPSAFLYDATHGKKKQRYYSSVKIPISTQHCAPRVVSRKNSATTTTTSATTSQHHWKLQIGDIICLKTNTDTIQPPACTTECRLARKKQITNTPHNSNTSTALEVHQQPQQRRGKQKHFPFTVPWSYAQVLNIYQQEKSKETLVALEIRWFLRWSETSIQLDSNPFKMDNDNNREEIFESNIIACDIPVSQVLGHVQGWLGHHTEHGCSQFEGGVTSNGMVPTVQARCRFVLIGNNLDRIQPIFCGYLTPKQWLRFMRERGKDVSKLCQKDEKLAYAISFTVDPEPNWMDDDDDMKSAATNNSLLVCSRQDNKEYLSQYMVTPPWINYCNPDLVCHPRFRNNSTVQWNVAIGDVVACHLIPSQKQQYGSGRHIWYPYTVPWTPCQVLAIVRDRSVGHDDCQFEVRWFSRADELTHVPNHHMEMSRRLHLDLVYELTDSPTTMVHERSFLGPITFLSIEQSGAQLSLPPSFMPLNIQLYGGTYNCRSEIHSPDTVAWSPLESVRRGIRETKTYGPTELNKLEILQQLEPSLTVEGEVRLPGRRGFPSDETPRKKPRRDLPFSNTPTSKDSSTLLTPEELTLDELRVWISEMPFHEDVSAKRSFYTELNVKPPYSDYSVLNRKANDEVVPDANIHWTVKLGDPVIVHWTTSAGKTYFDERGPQNAFFPFKVPWAVGEVTSIWMEHQNIDELPSKNGGSISPFDNRRGEIMIEIRWFYRENELPGAIRNRSLHRSAYSKQREEVLETDHVDETPATSLLAPVLLNPSPEEEEATKKHIGMPVVSFECRRMWSIYRKSLIPIGSMEGRVLRGRMNSQIFGKNKILQRALDEFLAGPSAPNNEDVALQINEPTWKSSFEKVIQRLALIDASEDGHERGAALVGREREQQTISSFLRTAIEGFDIESNAGGDAASSMLIGGPPGTGKTSTVCSIISQLQKEQATGLLPTFEFISLNGMEMRHPFESYVKFWEAISGCKEKKPPEIALAMLDQYFRLGTKGDDSASCTTSKPVVVLLLDEIDYLVTKKQTVIYNFFDWPRRTLENIGSPRLVVIGISNTLNLPSRLNPSVQSRIGNSPCVFKAYTASCLVNILTTKIQPDSTAYQVFDKDAIIFCARKVASASGDLRKAVKTCQSATIAVMKQFLDNSRDDPQFVSKDQQPMVRIRDVQKVLRESFGSIATQAVAASTPFQVLILVSLCALRKTSGKTEGGFDLKDVMTKMDAVAFASGNDQYLPPPSVSETLDLLTTLAESSLVSLETSKSTATSFRGGRGGSGGAFPLVSIGFDHFMIVQALKDTLHKELVEKHLGNYY